MGFEMRDRTHPEQGQLWVWDRGQDTPGGSSCGLGTDQVTPVCPESPDPPALPPKKQDTAPSSRF